MLIAGLGYAFEKEMLLAISSPIACGELQYFTTTSEYVSGLSSSKNLYLTMDVPIDSLAIKSPVKLSTYAPGSILIPSGLSSTSGG